MEHNLEVMNAFNIYTSNEPEYSMLTAPIRVSAQFPPAYNSGLLAMKSRFIAKLVFFIQIATGTILRNNPLSNN